MRKTIDQKILLNKRFTNLSAPSQHLWMMLRLHPKTSALGVYDQPSGRLDAYTRGVTPETIRQAERELVEEGLAVIDETTGETLLLNAIDRTADLGAIESAYIGIASPRLRETLAEELERMRATGDTFAFDWSELSDILSETFKTGAGHEPDASVKKDHEDATVMENALEQVGKRRGRPRKNPTQATIKDTTPKRRRGKPGKHATRPVELTDGTMEPPFGEPISMEQAEKLPQCDASAPLDIDDAGNPVYVRWEDIPERLWFYHPLPDDWEPNEDEARLYRNLGGGGKMTLSEAAESFRSLYEKELYVLRPNGFKAAWLTPDRLFAQQLLHWRREKDEENASKAQEPAETDGSDVLEAVIVPDGTETNTTVETEPEDEGLDTGRRKRLVPKEWKPNRHHHDKAGELNLDVDAEAEKFYDYSHANGRKYLDFDRAFNIWLLNADRFHGNGRTERRRTRSEEGYEHNMNMLKDAIAQAGWSD